MSEDTQAPGQHSASILADHGELLTVRTLTGKRILIRLSSDRHTTQLQLTLEESRAVLRELALAVAAIEGQKPAAKT